MKFIKEIPSIGPAGFLQNNRGFTLIEAMVVLAIVSVMVGLAYSSFKSSDEKLACRYIFSNLQLEKMEAITQSADHTVDIDATLMAGLVNVTLNVDYRFLLNAPTNPVAITFPWVADGINFNGNNTVIFNSKGMPDSRGVVYVQRVEDPERLCAITVSTAGMVKMSTSIDGGATWT